MRARVRRLLLILAWAWVALTLVVTLFPTHGMSRRLTLCLVCGSRGMSDVLLNVLLFLPIGGLLSSLRSMTATRAVVIGSAFSLAIETTQWFALPGRNPSVGDLVFNTIGAVLGVLIVRKARDVWARPEVPRLAVSGAVALALGGWIATGLLLQPSYPQTEWVGQWTPRLGHLAPYSGSVESAALAGLPLTNDALSEETRLRLAEEFDLSVVFVAGEPTPRLAPIVSIYDRHQEQILLFGVDGRDVVFRYRRRADDVALDVPDVRWRDAASFEVGERVTANLSGTTQTLCLTVQRDAPVCVRTNDLGWGWSLLMYPAWLPHRWRDALGFLWMIATGGFVGLFLLSVRPTVLAAVALASGLWGIPLLVSVPPSSSVLYGGLFSGLFLGAILGRGLRWFLRPSAATAQEANASSWV